MDPLFLGIFNVVPCGVLWFLAEYQLEHIIENQREKKYIKSLMKILKTDTAAFKTYNNLERKQKI